MSDEPPDYIDWGNNRSGSSFFGCIAAGIGALFMLTGGLCVFTGISGTGFVPLVIGLVMLAIGWALFKSGA
jgi:hypothetical protein